MNTKTVIFDIDGTLLDSAAFDGRLYLAAARDVLGDVSISDLNGYPEQTDTGILMSICEQNGLLLDEYLPSVRSRFGELVAEYLRSGFECSPIPGAMSLFHRLSQSDNIHIGIATGGWGHTAAMKLDHAGFDRKGIPFASSDHADRRVTIMQHCRSCIPATDTTIYVGDGEWDQLATAQLGWEFVGVGDRLRGKCENWVADLSSLSILDK